MYIKSCNTKIHKRKFAKFPRNLQIIRSSSFPKQLFAIYQSVAEHVLLFHRGLRGAWIPTTQSCPGLQDLHLLARVNHQVIRIHIQ